MTTQHDRYYILYRIVSNFTTPHAYMYIRYTRKDDIMPGAKYQMVQRVFTLFVDCRKQYIDRQIYVFKVLVCLTTMDDATMFMYLIVLCYGAHGDFHQKYSVIFTYQDFLFRLLEQLAPILNHKLNFYYLYIQLTTITTVAIYIIHVKQLSISCIIVIKRTHLNYVLTPTNN